MEVLMGWMLTTFILLQFVGGLIPLYAFYRDYREKKETTEEILNNYNSIDLIDESIFDP